VGADDGSRIGLAEGVARASRRQPCRVGRGEHAATSHGLEGRRAARPRGGRHEDGRREARSRRRSPSGDVSFDIRCTTGRRARRRRARGQAFNAGKQAKLAPLWAHLGLILLVVGAVWATQPPPGGKLMVRALLKVQDSRTGAIGHFDMVQDDPRQFFQWRAQYVIRSYSASRAGLGPAIRLERAFPDQQRRDDFWVYRDAPEEFDQKHRQGMVSISAKKLGIVPVPGSGLTSSGAAVLLLFGLGFLVYGAAAGTQAQGRLWIDVDGRDVRLAGAPQKAGDPLFTQAFRRWDLVARTALTE